MLPRFLVCSSLFGLFGDARFNSHSSHVQRAGVFFLLLSSPDVGRRKRKNRKGFVFSNNNCVCAVATFVSGHRPLVSFLFMAWGPRNSLLTITEGHHGTEMSNKLQKYESRGPEWQISPHNSFLNLWRKWKFRMFSLQKKRSFEQGCVFPPAAMPTMPGRVSVI